MGNLPAYLLFAGNYLLFAGILQEFAFLGCEQEVNN
jgi:hypothetical protein